MSIKSVIKSERWSQSERYKPGESRGQKKKKKGGECQPAWLSPSSVIARGNRGIVGVREGFPGVKQEGGGWEMTACTHFQVVELGEEGSRFKATLRANKTEIQYKFKE